MKVLRNELNVDETRTNPDWNSYVGEYKNEPVMVEYADWDNGKNYVWITTKNEYIQYCKENELCTAEVAATEFENTCY